jgi:hypothetical protein
MKRLALVLTAAVAGVAIYATTAPAGQQAVTPAQLNAVKKRVSNIESVLGACMQGGVPVTRYDGYVVRNTTDQTEFVSSALDVTDQGDQSTAYLLDVGPDCASALNQTLHIQLRRVHLSGTRR